MKPTTIRDAIQQTGYTKGGRFIKNPTMNAFEKRVDQAEAQIKDIFRSVVGENKKHIAILSNKDLIFTGKLIEGRTIKDWIKYGYNQRGDEITKRTERL